ncbi:Endonuclease/exonuclease/phosphatase [Cordyceps javanica]|nr:Endonuclease/exonuclease/phosphatase [Cordyceps javanica]
MAPAPPNAASAGDAPRRDTPVSPNPLEGPQRVITRDSIPVRTRPFTGSSSPIRQQSVRPAIEKRQQQSNTNRFAPLATQNQDADDPLADAEVLIAEAQNQLDTRASILRAYSQAIAKCAEQFSSGYGKRFAQHLRSTILQHWSAASYHETTPAPDHTAVLDSAENTSRTATLEKQATFAGVTRAADEAQPGNRKITIKDAPRRKTQAPKNNKRVLIRLRKDSNFFDKALQIQLAIRDKLHLQLADLLDMKEINTGFASTPRTVEIQQKITQNQQQRGPLVGLEIAEKDIEWHTYLIKNFPRTITSWDGTELDYKQTVEEAIKEQTGLHPVRWRSTETDNLTTTLIIHFDQPLKSRFRLLGLGDLSFQLTKPLRLTLCNTCWLFHTPTQCQKPKVCGNCGSRIHDRESCKASTRCVGCHGPHDTGSPECFALPKRTAHGTRALSKTEHNHAIRQGKAAYERWELSQRQPRPTETTQAPAEDQEARDVEMIEAENSNHIELELQHSTTEEFNTGNPEEINLAEENMGIMAEVERKADEVAGGALQLAYEKDYNVVLLQKPHSSYNEKKDICRVPDHPGFTCFSPASYWNSRATRPRVLTYVRKHRKIQPEQLTVVPSRDLLWIVVNGTTILNVYNDPQVTETITAITQWNVPMNTIVAGDMNAHHLHWRTDRPSSRCGTKLAEWAEGQGLLLLNEPDVDTTRSTPYRRATTIDLAFSNIDQAAAVVEEYLTTGSLHFTVCIEVLAAETPRRVASRYKVSLGDEMENFVAHVKRALASLQPLLDSHESIEQTTYSLSNIIETAIRTCGHRQSNHKAGKNPWWNEEYANTLLDFRVLWRTTENPTGEETQRARYPRPDRFLCEIIINARKSTDTIKNRSPEDTGTAVNRALGGTPAAAARHLPSGDVVVTLHQEPRAHIDEQTWVAFDPEAHLARRVYSMVVRGVPADDIPQDTPSLQLDLTTTNSINIVMARPMRTGGDRGKTTALLIRVYDVNQGSILCQKGALYKSQSFRCEPYSGTARPLRCYQCHRFGHMARFCREQKRCGKCAVGEHSEGVPCPADTDSKKHRSINCEGSHPAWDRGCRGGRSKEQGPRGLSQPATDVRGTHAGRTATPITPPGIAEETQRRTR